MKVVVCIKQTPSTTAVFSVDNGTVSWEDPGGKPNVVNPWDEYAIEEAIRLKENHGATDAIAISVGEESSKDALKTSLAMGCTEAILVSDESFAGSDSLGTARILAAAMCSGMSQYSLEVATDYAKERKVFRDTPIGAYQGIAHPLAMCKAEHEAARGMMLKAAWAFDEDWDSGKVGSLANMCKLLNSESAIHSVDAAIETLGGSAFTKESGLLNLWSGARLLKTAPVSKEMVLNFIAEWELGLPKSY